MEALSKLLAHRKWCAGRYYILGINPDPIHNLNKYKYISGYFCFIALYSDKKMDKTYIVSKIIPYHDSHLS